MSQRKRGSRSFVVAALLLTATLGGSAMQPAAGSHNPVTAVTGSAYGYSFVGTFFGGPQSSGPDPTVSIATSGGNQSVTDPDGASVLIENVALIYQSGATTVSSNGTTGVGGTVTSSSRVLGYQDPNESPSDPAGDGPDPFTWQDLRGDCSASASGATATTSVAMGVVVTSTNPTTGDPTSSVNVPANPAPNTVINGTINHTPGGGATFSITFNEQSVSPNGVLTLTAAHMRFLSGPLLGDLWIGRAVCGVTVGAAAHAPVARDDTYSTPYQTTLNVPAPGVLANDVDEDGGTLTAQMPTTPANGTVTLNANGSFSYVPNAGFSGTDTFEYMVHDAGNLMDTGLVTITVGAAPNRPPVATNDGYSTPYQTPLTVNAPGVLGNDSDPDGNALTAVLVAQPANGSVTLNSNGSFTFTPAAGFSGQTSFTYQARDTANANSNTATATITVGAAPPVAPVAANDTYSTNYQTALTVNPPGVLANDTDGNNDPLTAVLVAGPANGTLTLNANGSFTYTPAAGFSGPDSFTYRASDGALTSNVAAVTITVGARPASADVSVTIDDSTDPVGTRGLLTYTVTVANGGPDAAAQVTALIGLPAGSRLQSYSGATCTELKGKMRGLACDLGTMAFPASSQILVTITAPTKPATLTATASASSDTADPNPTNNTASEQTVVVRP